MPEHHETPIQPPAPVAASAPPPAVAVKVNCDKPPFGSDARKYQDVAIILGAENIRDVFRNACRAKYRHDAKLRTALKQIGISDAEIDGNDPGYVALKVLYENVVLWCATSGSGNPLCGQAR